MMKQPMFNDTSVTPQLVVLRICHHTVLVVHIHQEIVRYMELYPQYTSTVSEHR